MKVVFCWSDISGYIAACWRALAQYSDVDLHVIAYHVGAGERHIAFSESIMRGIEHELLPSLIANDPNQVIQKVADLNPDVVVLPGWFNPAYAALATEPRFSSVKFIMTMDTPWRNQWRQKVARFKIGSYVDRMSAVVVAGERAWQYARQLQIPEQKILRGVYGFDAAPMEQLLENRRAGGWPKKFLYVGRYVEDKAVDVLLAGYEAYRSASRDPWPLTCCGKGPMQEKVAGTRGVVDLGFVQPAELPRVLQEHGAFVLVSRYEPWGVALAEAQYAGLPVIGSEACGASVEIVRDRASGLLVPTEDAAALARAMRWMEEHVNELPEMGAIGKGMAKPFGAELWARRWKARLDQIMSV